MPAVNESPLSPSRKRKLSPERRRVLLSVRVLPQTMKYLESMGYATPGRALDVLIKAMQHPGVRRMMDAGQMVSIVNLMG